MGLQEKGEEETDSAAAAPDPKDVCLQSSLSGPSINQVGCGVTNGKVSV